MGENGAGKSTLLKALAGGLPADRGEVTRSGTLGPEHGPELVRRPGLERSPGTVTGELSGGTRQKPDLVLALPDDPDVLLPDEPYQGFDRKAYLRFRDLDEEPRTRGKAVVAVTRLVDGRLVPCATTAVRFSVRDRTRDRPGGLLLVLFVPAGYLLVGVPAAGEVLESGPYATGDVPHADGGRLTLITAGLDCVTAIAGLVVFDAVRKALAVPLFWRPAVGAGARCPPGSRSSPAPTARSVCSSGCWSSVASRASSSSSWAG